MQRAVRTGSKRPTKAEWQASSLFRPDRLAALLALTIAVCLGAAFFLFPNTQFLMPGPLASAHGAIENCNSCHTKSGSGKLSWLHGLVSGDPLADSKACFTCHKMPDTAFSAHGTSKKVLTQITNRLTKVAKGTPAPEWAFTQTAIFPTQNVTARGLACATCHQEHQGVGSDLTKISNEKCTSCHVVKFDSFDSHHPEFENYPFKRRTRIIYDHEAHFSKHFSEVAKKYPGRRIPDTCSTCHNSHEDKRVMAVAPFEQTCTGCHLNQILGKERASGPKGIAFLTLPGIDLQTLKKKNALIGEWPDASEAELTPFMKVMISRNERGRAVIKTVNSLNLLDLTGANDEQIDAVSKLVWEIKGLFYALISGKASDVLADLDLGGGARLSTDLVADLTASIPRDVVISAQQEWLPNLAAEIANPQTANSQTQSAWSAAITAAPTNSGSDAKSEHPAASSEVEVSETGSIAKLDPPVCTVRIFGQCLMSKERQGEAEAAKAEPTKPEGAVRESDDAREEIKASSADEQSPDSTAERESGQADTANAQGASQSAETLPAHEQSPAAVADEVAAQVEPTNPLADRNTKIMRTDDQPPKRRAGQTDDLLFPTEDERRAIEASIKHARKAQPDGTAGTSDLEIAVNERETGTASPIKSDVDAENWAEYGGWYRQDYAIYYRPTGHKDKFIFAWLSLSGPRAPKGDTSPAAAIFDFLTSKDAQGSCTKCHSVDDLRGKGRLVNFSPLSVKSKQGSFTNFIHEPHFQAVGMGQRIGILENRGCLTCHDLKKGAPYLKSYEQGDLQNFVSNFGEAKKDLCQTCHNKNTARQDCLLCHRYHVNGVNTQIMNTKIPTE